MQKIFWVRWHHFCETDSSLLVSTQWDVSNKMLNHLLKTGRDEVALHLMEWMWKSPHTPSTFSAHLMEHLINSGREDLIMELMDTQAAYPATRALIRSTPHAGCIPCRTKHSVCASHKTTLSMLSSTHIYTCIAKWCTHKIFKCIK